MNALLHPYTVITIDRRHKRSRHTTDATNWYAAWKWAANTFGLTALVCVKPSKERRP